MNLTPEQEALVEAGARVLCAKAIRERRKWDTSTDRIEAMLPQAVDVSWRDFADDARAIIPLIYAAGRRAGREEAAFLVEGQPGVIPAAAVFASLVSGNNMPCMSGDPRDRLPSHRRRAFDDATQALATAIRNLSEQESGR